MREAKIPIALRVDADVKRMAQDMAKARGQSLTTVVQRAIASAYALFVRKKKGAA